MKHIPLEKVRKDNTNLRKFDDKLWRVLRKERFKKANPDLFVNEMAAEEQGLQYKTHTDFDTDVATFIKTRLNKREAEIFHLYLYGGKITQTDIGDMLGVCQATVTNTLQGVLALFHAYYYSDINKNLLARGSKNE